MSKIDAELEKMCIRDRKSDVLERLGLEKDKYILLSAHREMCIRDSIGATWHIKGFHNGCPRRKLVKCYSFNANRLPYVVALSS